MGALVKPMNLFAVIGDDPARIDKAIMDAFPDQFYKFGEGEWFVYAEGTAKEVSEKIGVPGGGRGRAVVLNVSGYFGFHSKDLWEWIASKGTVNA